MYSDNFPYSIFVVVEMSVFFFTAKRFQVWSSSEFVPRFQERLQLACLLD